MRSDKQLKLAAEVYDTLVDLAGELDYFAQCGRSAGEPSLQALLEAISMIDVEVLADALDDAGVSAKDLKMTRL